MSPGPTKRYAKLSRLWQRWTEIVARLSQNTRRAEKLSTEKYKQLHSDLLQELEAAIGNDEQHHATLQRMRVECRPWVSLEAFSQAEGHILRDVVRRARELHGQLVGHRSLPGRVRFRTIAALLATITAVGVYFVLSRFSAVVSDTGFQYEMRGFVYRLGYRFSQFAPLEILVAILVIVVIGGVFLLRGARSY